VTWDSMGRILRTGKSSPSWRDRDDLYGCTAQRHRSPTSLRQIPEAKGTIACWPRVSMSWAKRHTRCCCHDPRPEVKNGKLVEIQEFMKFEANSPSPNLMKSYP
jgi:hypothetical protein